MKKINARSLMKKQITVAIASFTVVLLMFTTFATAIETVKIQSTGKTYLSGSIELTSDYTLTEDITFETGHGFIIKADGITLDGAGYKITGDKTIESCEWISATDPNIENSAHGVLNSGYDNVVIENLEIENFATGIWLHGTGVNNVENNHIENCIIHDNGLNDMGISGSECVTHGIHAVYTKNTEIINNEIYDNEGTGSGCEDGGNGIYMHGGDGQPDLNTISGNDLYNNAKSGFWMKKQSDYVTISDNHVYSNGNGAGITDPARGGIMLRCKSTNYNTIELNHVENNYGDGIFIGGNNNDIENNEVTSNDAIGVNFARNDGSQNNYLYENIICSNGDFDVFNVYDDFGGGNTGDENTGDTASNYRDEGTSGDIYFTYSCAGENEPPTAPDIDGPGEGTAGESYDYSFETTDPDEDDVYYYIEWGDGETEEWIGPYASGDEIIVSHIWDEKGDYTIRAKAKDIHDLESDWGTLPVTMPKSKTVYLPILHKILENHPLLKLLFNYLF
jgi:parallel beta-helix repeat protein